MAASALDFNSVFSFFLFSHEVSTIVRFPFVKTRMCLRMNRHAPFDKNCRIYRERDPLFRPNMTAEIIVEFQSLEFGEYYFWAHFGSSSEKELGFSPFLTNLANAAIRQLIGIGDAGKLANFVHIEKLDVGGTR